MVTNPIGWDEAAAEIIARDDDLEEPPVYVSGHCAFLDCEARYQGWQDSEAHDE